MKYSPLSGQSEASDWNSQRLEDSEALLSNSSPTKKQQTNNLLAWGALVVILVPSLVGLGIWIGARGFANPNNFCANHVQNYSPVLKEVDTALHKVRFDGSFLKTNEFRLDAGPEVDAAWESLGVDLRSLVVPASEAAKSSLKPSQVQINEKYGGGYPANIEGLHHLHCLNLVRQSLYYNYDYYKAKGEGAFTNDDNIVKHHVSHCLDIVRQQLMCKPDTGVLGQVWWDKGFPKAFVDFNTDHKCKNFDAIKQWAEERQMPETVPEDYLQPPASEDDVYDAIP